MTRNSSPRSLLFLPLLLSTLCTITAQSFDFFYFVQQWPGSYCDSRRSCCYPTSGKPASDFGIHGLWPNNNDGSYPSNCDPDSPYDPSQIKDLLSSMKANWPTLACPSSDGSEFWSHEWEKHGTCSESILDQHSYFEASLQLKKQTNLLQILEDAGIHPDGELYSLNSIRSAISDGIGYTPGIECNVDESGNNQLFQVYLCVDTSATNLTDCPVYPRSKCSSSSIEFPSF
ncbi:extracellular ribonuclease LE-like [Zingiber officinale]|uniref:extracellular ribonuclease LE-like n=1 Tax=Zingiber officinale TaxID=94328 RepID=UPI001C4C1CDB|nr:extracellular ribonuclease LE-like [Zingiber officinale]